jgi:hypothetical protein
MNGFVSRRVGVCLLSSLLVACAGVDDLDGVDVETAALESSNRLIFNRLVFNRLVFNRLIFNRLIFNKLTLEGFMSGGQLADPDLSDALRDPDAREVFGFIVSCALPETEVVSVPLDGAVYAFPGGVGLAPEWQTDSCGDSCQRWVTACLLSRVNSQGVSVPISLRGPHPALSQVSAEENRTFPLEESAFYGNLFQSSRELHVCTGKNAEAAALRERMCTFQDPACYEMFVGPCHQLGNPNVRDLPDPGPHKQELRQEPKADGLKSCGAYDPAVGYYWDCHNTTVKLFDTFPDKPQFEAITVYTKAARDPHPL